jgi:hypothetical protein
LLALEGQQQSPVFLSLDWQARVAGRDCLWLALPENSLLLGEIWLHNAYSALAKEYYLFYHETCTLGCSVFKNEEFSSVPSKIMPWTNFKKYFNFVCVVSVPEFWQKVIEMSVQEFELPGITE